MKESLALVADWLTLSIQVWKDDPSAELTLLYRETLKDIPPDLLSKAFIRVAKTAKFRPTPADIREAAEVEASIANRGNRPKYLDEKPLTAEEWKELFNDQQYLEMKAKLGAK